MPHHAMPDRQSNTDAIGAGPICDGAPPLAGAEHACAGKAIIPGILATGDGKPCLQHDDQRSGNRMRS
jgi:hypothetical protein